MKGSSTTVGNEQAAVSRGAGARRILLATTNGAGLGHLMRVMTVAKQFRNSHAVIATQSQAAPLAESMGFLVEYVPSYGYLRGSRHRWQNFLRNRMNDIIGYYKPAVLVFDGPVPYQGLAQSWIASGLPTVWLRRAMWKPEVSSRWLYMGSFFDEIIEPGDLAIASDHGPTSAWRHEIQQCGPLTSVTEEVMLARGDARDALDLPAMAKFALVSLGAGAINDVASTQTEVVGQLQKHGYTPIVIPSPLSTAPPLVADGVLTRKIFPLGPYLRAFDVIVGASGYNSFHENLLSNTPTLFIPNLQTGVDDQRARARAAERAGAALVLESPERSSCARAIKLLVDASVQTRLRRGAALFTRGVENGAEYAANLIEAAAIDAKVRV